MVCEVVMLAFAVTMKKSLSVCPSLPKKKTLTSVSPGMRLEMVDQSNPSPKMSVAVRTVEY